ncbi:hypothetical protein Taro_036983 [Colocasia esculenta]|uniref:Uncharacterized protein n=1 Tax=Colocasia esculenta TaxID=4460 RepID=A0A843WEY1_COLES|nr:hypothetical protein [Colocasia esculenta]
MASTTLTRKGTRKMSRSDPISYHGVVVVGVGGQEVVADLLASSYVVVDCMILAAVSVDV